MSRRCARCEWTETDEEPLAVHAIGSGHPLCVVCARSLTDAEPQVCERCLNASQELLSGTVTMWLELDDTLGTLHAPKRGSEARSSDGTPLPGGDRLVMLSGGSEGVTDDGATALDTDPPSIPFELAWWALGWADLRHEPAMLLLTASTTRSVLKAAGYLETRMRWAATSHPRFEHFHTDLRRLHAALEHATARDLPRDDTGTRCLDCREELVRLYDRHTGLAQDHVTCTGCHREYTPAAYHLAQAATLDANLGWLGQAEAARRADVWAATVRQWAQREQVRTQLGPSGRREVWWPDVRDRARELGRRAS